MEKEILDLEKNLFKYEYISNPAWLNGVIHDNFVECGKSGLLFNKNDTVKELSSFDSDRKIEIYNFECNKIDSNTYLVHYITKNNDDLIYRTSIWSLDDNGGLKILFHQASIMNAPTELMRF